MHLKDLIRSNIRYYRIKKSITQNEMSNYLNISEKHYNRLENGRYCFSLYLIDDILSILDISIVDLVNELK